MENLTTGLFKLIADKCIDFDLTMIFSRANNGELSVVMIPKFKGGKDDKDEKHLPIMTISGDPEVVESNITDIFSGPIDTTKMIASNIAFYRKQLEKFEKDEKEKLEKKSGKGETKKTGDTGKEKTASGSVKQPAGNTGNTGLFDNPQPQSEKQAQPGPTPAKEDTPKPESVKEEKPADIFSQPPTGPAPADPEPEKPYSPITVDDDF